jgi:competence protein ComEC
MRKLADAAFAFCAGVFLAQYLLTPGRPALLAAACAALAGLAGLFLWGRARLRVFLLAGGAALGLAYSALWAAAVQAPAQALAGTERPDAVLTLCGYPAATDYGAKVPVRLEGLTARAMYYGDESLLELTPGCTVTDSVYFTSAAKIRDSDVTVFTSRGIFLLAYGRGEASSGPGSAASPRWWPARLGHALQERIASLFTGDTAGFLTAILTGDKSALSEGAASDLREAGLYHILAVSGLHCSFLLGMVMVLTGRHRRRLTAAVGVPVLLFYMVLTGCTPSVVRACVMLLFLLAAPLARREDDPTTAMAAALLVILLANPFAAASIGLQLSFAAVGGILWAAPAIRHLLAGSRQGTRLTRFLLDSISVSLGVTVFSAPLAAVYFHIFWLVMPLSSLLCLWAAGLIFSLGLPAALLGFLSPALGRAVGLVPALLIRYVLEASHLLARLPWHAVYFSNPFLPYWLAFAYGIFALAALLGPPARRKYALAGGLTLAALAVAVGLGQRLFTAGTLNVTVLDVGQGECVLLSSAGSFAAVDCGSANSWYDPGGIAADNLAGMGCRELRYLLLTHYDYDHVCGVGELLSRVPTDTLLVPDRVDDAGLRTYVLAMARHTGTRVEFVTDETVRTLGASALTVYPPLGSGDDNDRGLSLLCSAGDYDLLVTGDMDQATEHLLLTRYQLADIEALVVGHHGSRTSTSSELLAALRPEVALISVGDNRYGHPARQTLQRLTDAGVTVRRTDLEGNLYLYVK